MTASLKTIIHEFFNLKEKELPDWVKIETKENISLTSYLWNSDLLSKVRLCEFKVKDKFYAESLIIYPNKHLESPIFGTEYLKIGEKKYFGAIDFHPINQKCDYLKFIDEFPDRRQEKEIFYDFSKFFSKKLWIRRRNNDFYSEYQIMVKCFLHQYKKCLESSKETKLSYDDIHKNYNEYMSENDPAFGILKSYFGSEFSEKYINNFLFSNK